MSCAMPLDSVSLETMMIPQEGCLLEPLEECLQEPNAESDIFLTSDTMETTLTLNFDKDPFPCLADELQEQVKSLEHNFDTRNQESKQEQHQKALASIKNQHLTSISFLHGLPRGAPFAAALHNADCIRQGISSPWPSAWAGCLEGPWCNKERSHPGSCNNRATIPGLSAYLPEELAAVGLPFTAELLTPLPPMAAAKANAAADAYAAHLKSIGAKPIKDTSKHHHHTTIRNTNGEIILAHHALDSLTASDNDSNNAEDDGDTAYARNDKKNMKSVDGNKLIDHGSLGDGTDNETASEELRSSLTAEAKLRPSSHHAGGETSGAATKKVRRRHHATTKHHHNHHHHNHHHHDTEDLNTNDMIHNKHNRQHHQYHRQHHHGVTKHKGYSTASSAAAAMMQNGIPGSQAHTTTKGPSRRSPPVWIRGEVTDPRTGEVLTTVPPATFCTQCSALNTPVWRAGPFGHKTLCNACGVRYMKVAARRK